MSNNILRHNGFELDFSEGEMISLTQLWKMMGSPESQSPYRWKILPESKRLIACATEILERECLPFNPIVIRRSGSTSETFALKPIAKMYEIYLFKSQAKTSEKQGYIYLLEGSNILKFGFARDVKQEIKALCRWRNELKLIASKEGDASQERSYHRHLHTTGRYFGNGWYPFVRKNEILRLIC